MKSLINLILTSILITSCISTSEPIGPGVSCIDGSTNSVNKISNNLHEFYITDDQCLKYYPSIEKKELTLTVEQPIPAGFSISNTAKITNYGWWNSYAFEITNHSGNTFCNVKFSNLSFIDALENDIASKEVEFLEGVNVSGIDSYDSCILDGQTLTVAGTLSPNEEDISSASNFVISEVSAQINNDNILDQAQIDSLRMDWNDDVINFHLINNSLSDIVLGGEVFNAKYFDANGYYINLDYFEPPIEPEAVKAGEQFVVYSNFYYRHDNARKVQISISWSDQ